MIVQSLYMVEISYQKWFRTLVRVLVLCETGVKKKSSRMLGVKEQVT